MRLSEYKTSDNIIDFPEDYSYEDQIKIGFMQRLWRRPFGSRIYCYNYGICCCAKTNRCAWISFLTIVITSGFATLALFLLISTDNLEIGSFTSQGLSNFMGITENNITISEQNKNNPPTKNNTITALSILPQTNFSRNELFIKNVKNNTEEIHFRKKRNTNFNFKRELNKEYSKYVDKAKELSDCENYFKEFSESLNKKFSQMKDVPQEMLKIKDEMILEGLNSCRQRVQKQNDDTVENKIINSFSTTIENKNNSQASNNMNSEITESQPNADKKNHSDIDLSHNSTKQPILHDLIKGNELTHDSSSKSELKTSFKTFSQYFGIENSNKKKLGQEVTDNKQNNDDFSDLYKQNLNPLKVDSYNNYNYGDISSYQNNYAIFDPSNTQPKVVLGQQYTPTGPDGSNYEKFIESMTSSQQITFAHNNMWKPICYRAPKQSGIVCLPVRAQQNNYRTVTRPQLDDIENDETCSDDDEWCKNGKSAASNPLPISNPLTGDATGPQQPIIIGPTNPPAIHVPTAISSPNPYYFPTVAGNPVLTPISSPGAFSPYYAMPQMPPLIVQQNPPMMYQPQQQPYMLPQQFLPPQQQNFQLNQPQVYQPNYQEILKPQPNYLPSQQAFIPPTPFSNMPNLYYPSQSAAMYSPQVQHQPFYCTYVPTQTYKFPVVNGVMEVRESKTNSTIDNDLGQNETEVTAKMNSVNCSPGNMPCSSGDICIQASRWCNGIVDCLDASDESSCSCKNRVDKDRLCDGYFDCPAGEDELGCFGCKENYFSCGNWSSQIRDNTCIPLSKRCDNIPDCANGKDEADCHMLLESHHLKETFTVSFTSGYLHRNWKGKWYPVCSGPYVNEWVISACFAEVGHFDRTPVVKMAPSQFKDSFIVPGGKDHIFFKNMCEKEKVTTYVTCPKIPCGTRIERNELRSRRDTIKGPIQRIPIFNVPDIQQPQINVDINLSPSVPYTPSLMDDFYNMKLQYGQYDVDNSGYNQLNNGDFNQPNYGDYNQINNGDYSQSNNGNYYTINNEDYGQQNNDVYNQINNGDYGQQNNDVYNQINSNYLPGYYSFRSNGNNGNENSGQLLREGEEITFREQNNPQTMIHYPILSNNKFDHELYSENQMKESNENKDSFDYFESTSALDEPLLFYLGNLENFTENSNNLDQQRFNMSNHKLLASKDQSYKTVYEPDVLNENSLLLPDWKRVTRHEKVVGGIESQPAEWPWIVALYKNGKFHCGGVILNALWVLTAAHCVENYSEKYFEVQAGMLRRFSFSPQEQTRSVSYIVVHVMYNRADMQNDLALLKLNSKLKFNRWVRPICLPAPQPPWGPVSGTVCTAVGWGATVEHGPDPDHMHQVDVPILPYCKHRADLEGAELCAGLRQGGRDTCQGDSGGPLLCRAPHHPGKWYVAGVVSHGEGCARPDEPGVYTRIAIFTEWIKRNIHDDFLPLSQPLQKCPGFQCNFGRRCIPASGRCNGQVDCLNAEDEVGCEDIFINNLKASNPFNDVSRNSKLQSSNNTLHEDYFFSGSTENKTSMDVELKNQQLPATQVTDRGHYYSSLHNQIKNLEQSCKDCELEKEHSISNEDIESSEEKKEYPNFNQSEDLYNLREHNSFEEDSSSDTKSEMGKEYSNMELVEMKEDGNNIIESNRFLNEEKSESYEKGSKNSIEIVRKNNDTDLKDEEERVIQNQENNIYVEKINTSTILKQLGDNLKTETEGHENNFPLQEMHNKQINICQSCETDLNDTEIRNQNMKVEEEQIKSSEEKHKFVQNNFNKEEEHSRTEINEHSSLFKKTNTTITNQQMENEEQNEQTRENNEQLTYRNASININKIEEHSMSQVNEQKENNLINKTNEQTSCENCETDLVNSENIENSQLQNININLLNQSEKRQSGRQYGVSNIPCIETTNDDNSAEIYSEDGIDNVNSSNIINETEDQTHSLDSASSSEYRNAMVELDIMKSFHMPNRNKSLARMSTNDGSKGIISGKANSVDSYPSEIDLIQLNLQKESENFDRMITEFFNSINFTVHTSSNEKIYFNNKNLKNNFYDSSSIENSFVNVTGYDTFSNLSYYSSPDNSTEYDGFANVTAYDVFPNNYTQESPEIQFDNIASSTINPKDLSSNDTFYVTENIFSSKDIHEQVKDSRKTVLNNINNTGLNLHQRTYQFHGNGTRNFFCTRIYQAFQAKRRCDGIVDCEDGSDEQDCSCRDRLIHTSKSLICDGIAQCSDFSDEENCPDKCDKNQFYCYKSKHCVPEKMRCDHKRQCRFGEDEQDCYALTNGITLERDVAGRPVFRDLGIVSEYKESQWYPMCLDSTSHTSIAFHTCSALGYFGFNYFGEVEVKNVSLIETNTTKIVENTSNSSTCYGLKIKCLSIRDGMPWLGAVFVEGDLVTSAALITEHWLIADAKAMEDIDPGRSYVEVSLGRDSLSTLGLTSLYTQNIRIDYIQLIPDISMCVLHLSTAPVLSHKVKPLTLPHWLSPLKQNESCYAIGHHSTRGPVKIPLKHVTNTCSSDSKCFTVPRLIKECKNEDTLPESGLIMCQTSQNWHVTATYQDAKDFCNARDLISFKYNSDFIKIVSDVINTQAINYSAVPPCDGLRCRQCIDWSRIADGISDCGDNQDESVQMYLQKKEACFKNSSLCSCPIDKLQCTDGNCIDKTLFCNGHRDCADGSDEPAKCNNTCSHYLNVTSPQELCDGVRNCFDKSDEAWSLCNKTACEQKDAFQCNNSQICVPQDYICDGENDCPEGDDETFCMALERNNDRDEGLIMHRYYGIWSPQCFKNESLTTENLNNICKEFGQKCTYQVQIQTQPQLKTVPDAFSRVVLNSNVQNLVVRRQRPIVKMPLAKQKCLALYVSCY